MRFLTSSGFSSTSKPATVAVPEVGNRNPVRMRIVVVFPAPFGPRKPTICPFSTSNEMSLTATVRAYRFVRPSTLIILIVPTLKDVTGCNLVTPHALLMVNEISSYQGLGKYCQL